jgi:hypothetical protein
MAKDRVVVVPHSPGPVVPLDRPERGRDELDELIDELFPDTDEGPGWFDVALVAAGVGLVAWRLAGGPTAALVAGGVALALGSILPVRWLGQRVQRRRHRRRREALAARGVPLQVADPATERLVRAYEDLAQATGGVGTRREHGAEFAAAHGALLEVATQLRGRMPGSDSEREYTIARAAAIEELADALRRRQDPAPAGASPGPDPELVLEARNELDAITGTNALTRLDELTAEAKHGRAGT